MTVACRLPIISALFVTALVAPLDAEAANRSVYVDLRSCTIEASNAEEEVFYCRGPGGVGAALINMTTRVGLAFDTGAGYVPATPESILLSTSGGPFGSKLEWRMKPGASKPCAAILRVWAEAGQLLTVTDLSSGQMAGMVRSNGEAQSLADDLCR
jgi:hypothetical protein